MAIRRKVILLYCLSGLLTTSTGARFHPQNFPSVSHKCPQSALLCKGEGDGIGITAHQHRGPADCRRGGDARRLGASRRWGTYHVKKLAIAVALCGSLICSPVHAKTFVGVLWPMFGPLPAIGLMELVAELKTMPDVEVTTYVHQAWPSLVKDIDRQPPGTHTIVVGYSLGANSSVFVANNAKHVDLIIALQPSLFSWNPPLDAGKVGRMIEIYNPNRWMTFGGMGSRKLVGENIEYIANNDSHPGAQFDPQFRNLVKSEVAKFAAEDRMETAQADIPSSPVPASPLQLASFRPADERLPQQERNAAADDGVQFAQAEMSKLPEPAKPEHGARQRPASRLGVMTAFLDRLSGSVNSGDLPVERRLTIADLQDFAKRTYRDPPTAGLMTTASN